MVRKLGWILGGIFSITALISCSGGGGQDMSPVKPVPAEYKDKHMPAGWWTDPKILAEGKKVYEGKFDVDVNCSSCHGITGKPKKRGARDFRMADRMKLYSDSYMFWRISEGVPRTKMKAWKSKLDEEHRWMAMAYLWQFTELPPPVAKVSSPEPASEEPSSMEPSSTEPSSGG